MGGDRGYRLLLDRIRAQATEAPVIIAISGFAGAGKSTLSRRLAQDVPEVAVVGSDDFTLSRQSQRCDDWSSIDRRRLVTEVLGPASKRQVLRYQQYDWSNDQLGEWRSIDPPEVLVVEGIGILHPDLVRFYHLTVWLDVPLEVASERGRRRDLEDYRVDHNALWREVWTPNDRDYFDRFRPDRLADLVLSDQAL